MLTIAALYLFVRSLTSINGFLKTNKQHEKKTTLGRLCLGNV